MADEAATSPSEQQAPELPLCYYVNSYHMGYPWSDAIQKQFRESVEGHCRVIEFYMDTKRRKKSAQIIKAGQRAYEFIRALNPDIVITSDDNAAKHLVVPFLLQSQTPVVFSGINWTVSEYGFPADNVTGIVEVAPDRPLLEQGLKTTDHNKGQLVRIAYVGENTLTQLKNFERWQILTSRIGNITLDNLLVDNFTHWKSAFKSAQNYNLVIMGSNSGIANWDDAEAVKYAQLTSRKLSMTTVSWMMPYAVLGFTKVPEEHGEWAAATTIAILSGIRAGDIPLVTNRRWDTWINPSLLEKTGLGLDESIVNKAKKFH